jgi:hypothetical protein
VPPPGTRNSGERHRRTNRTGRRRVLRPLVHRHDASAPSAKSPPRSRFSCCRRHISA